MVPWRQDENEKQCQTCGNKVWCSAEAPSLSTQCAAALCASSAPSLSH